jgi:WD40 repeat protein
MGERKAWISAPAIAGLIILVLAVIVVVRAVVLQISPPSPVRTLVEYGFCLRCSTPPGVFDATFFPDGATMALGLSTATEVRRVADGELLRTLPSGTTFHVAVSPDGQLLATVAEHAVQLWRTADGVSLWTINTPARDSALAFSPDSRLLLAASESGIELRRIADGSLAGTVPGWAQNLALLPDGLLASAGLDTIRIWSLPQGGDGLVLPSTPLGTVPGWVFTAISPDGQLVAAPVSASASDVQIWHWRDGQARARLRPQSDDAQVHGVSFAADGQTLATVSAGSSNTLRLWRVADGMEIAQQKIDSTSSLEGGIFTPDSKTVAAWSLSAVYLWTLP